MIGGKLHIKFKVGDLVRPKKEFADSMGLRNELGIVTKIDPWFVGEISGCQAEAYRIHVLWYSHATLIHNISFHEDYFEIAARA